MQLIKLMVMKNKHNNNGQSRIKMFHSCLFLKKLCKSSSLKNSVRAPKKMGAVLASNKLKWKEAL